MGLIGGAGGSLFVAGTQRVEVEHVIAEGDLAAAQFRQIARTSTGRDYDNLYTFFFRIRDGQICELWENVDTGYAFALFGMEPTWVLGTPQTLWLLALRSAVSARSGRRLTIAGSLRAKGARNVEVESAGPAGYAAIDSREMQAGRE